MATMFLAATLALIGGSASEAQDQTPSPRMLLNLDLFTAPKDSGVAPSGAGADSMLHQLQALRSMGYLAPDGPLPEDYQESEAGDDPAPTPPPHQPELHQGERQ